MQTIKPEELATPQLHGILLGAITPRPIAFVSTVSRQGEVNLSPFSFFNVFSANPPVLIFSPARRVQGNTTKHTLDNVLEVPEACVSVVNYDMVQQVSLASTEYPRGVNEFIKAGFNQAPAERVAPPYVAESPVSFECKVLEVKALGHEGGAGNLVICEVVLIHLNNKILDEDGKIDPRKLDAVGRLGGNWYCRVQEPHIFEVAKPLKKLGIGIDRLPQAIRQSHVLTGNDLALLANVEAVPTAAQLAQALSDEERRELASMDETKRHRWAQKELQAGQTERAWAVLVA